MTVPRHCAEELQDLLDGRLAGPRHAEVSAHLAVCERCRRELAALESAKQAASAHVAEFMLPAELRARVLAVLDAEDLNARPAPTLVVQPVARPATWRRRAWVAGAATSALAAALLVVFARTRETVTLPQQVAAGFRAFDGGSAPLAIQSAEPKAIEAFFAANGAPFVTRVIDLAMMQYRLAGGRVDRLAGHTSAFYAYRGPGGVALVCQMFEGRVIELPPTADMREHNGIRFQVYTVDNVTLVFWQEGDIVCVLTSGISREDVVQLAFAKAQHAGGSAD